MAPLGVLHSVPRGRGGRAPASRTALPKLILHSAAKIESSFSSLRCVLMGENEAEDAAKERVL